MTDSDTRRSKMVAAGADSSREISLALRTFLATFSVRSLVARWEGIPDVVEDGPEMTFAMT
jgi:hypothetical protein